MQLASFSATDGAMAEGTLPYQHLEIEWMSSDVERLQMPMLPLLDSCLSVSITVNGVEPCIALQSSILTCAYAESVMAVVQTNEQESCAQIPEKGVLPSHCDTMERLGGDGCHCHASRHDRCQLLEKQCLICETNTERSSKVLQQSA